MLYILNYLHKIYIILGLYVRSYLSIYKQLTHDEILKYKRIKQHVIVMKG